MAVTLTVTQAYATIAEAGVYLSNSSVWAIAIDAERTEALLSARYYIDTNFSCDLSAVDVVPDELKYANALLANEALSDAAIFDSGPTVQRELAKAGSVTTETEYFVGNKSQPKVLSQIRGILKSICSNASSTVFLQRA